MKMLDECLATRVVRVTCDVDFDDIYFLFDPKNCQRRVK